MMEAGELLGVSDRQFRRYRDRYEEDGLDGLADGRLGRPSPKRVPAADAQLMLELYRRSYRGWNVKHFHEHLVRDHGFRWGYTWAKTQLHTAPQAHRRAVVSCWLAPWHCHKWLCGVRGLVEARLDRRRTLLRIV